MISALRSFTPFSTTRYVDDSLIAAWESVTGLLRGRNWYVETPTVPTEGTFIALRPVVRYNGPGGLVPFYWYSVP